MTECPLNQRRWVSEESREEVNPLVALGEGTITMSLAVASIKSIRILSYCDQQIMVCQVIFYINVRDHYSFPFSSSSLCFQQSSISEFSFSRANSFGSPSSLFPPLVEIQQSRSYLSRSLSFCFLSSFPLGPLPSLPLLESCWFLLMNLLLWVRSSLPWPLYFLGGFLL